MPVGMLAKKTFWSVLDPAKRTTYRCTTRYINRNRLNDY